MRVKLRYLGMKGKKVYFDLMHDNSVNHYVMQDYFYKKINAFQIPYNDLERDLQNKKNG